MGKVNYWSFSFIETKSLKIDLFTKENLKMLKGHSGKVSPEKKKFAVNKVL